MYNKEEGDGDHKTSQTDHSGSIKGNSETTEKSAQATKEQSEQHQQTDTQGQVRGGPIIRTDFSILTP